MFKVLLVEDEEIIRQGLKTTIEELVPEFRVVAEATSGSEALRLLYKDIPDLLVTDIRMGDLNGLELIRRVREQHPRLPVLIISGYSDFEYARLAVRYGVADYLLKPVDRSELGLFLFELRNTLTNTAPNTPSEKGQGSQEREHRQIIRKVRELVQQRLADEISLQYVAGQVGLNPAYLSHLFKTQTGQAFSDFVTEARMQRARQLLKETNLKIYEVANLCGYNSAKHFMAVFKQLVGHTPTEFRDSNL